MVGYLVVSVAIALVVLLVFLAFAGFRNGDYTGEALARSLRKDLEAATPRDRGAGRN